MVVRRLEAWDVEQHWPKIRSAAKTMFTPARKIRDEDLVELLTKLVSQQLQCWLITKSEVVVGIMLTALERDALFEKLYMHVLGFRSFIDSLGEDSIDILNTAVEAYAKRQKCEYVLAQAADERGEYLALKYGGKQLPYYYKEI